MRRLRIAAATTAGVLLGALVMPASAHAASVSITCPAPNTFVFDRLSIDVNETLVITATSCTQFQLPANAEGTANYAGVTYGPGSTVAYSGGPVTYTPPQARMVESQEITFINPTTPPGRYGLYITVLATDIPRQMWFQSVGRPADGVCESGWGASWEQWPNGGRGGFTCNRVVPGIGGFTYPTVQGNQGSG